LRRTRSVILRVLRPFTQYQHELDAAIFAAVQEIDREIREDHADRFERLESIEAITLELVQTAESLHRRLQHADRVRLDRAELEVVPYVAGRPFEQFSSTVGEVTGYRSPSADHAMGSAYVGFEDVFRGPPERVTELQRPYIPLVVAHQPVLDVGCGRGEFLSLLASEGIASHGVDSDPGMITRCREAGLTACVGDAIDYLEGLEDETLGTVFSAQVIEHLPPERLQRLLELSRRKLAPDGLFIAETVNPHNLAAFKTFWVDLTHQHPIFPEVALTLCALAGFAPAYVFAPGHQSFEQARFRSHSYAVVASSPAAKAT
jgi:SAM-dependent methyltransferase